MDKLHNSKNISETFKTMLSKLLPMPLLLYPNKCCYHTSKAEPRTLAFWRTYISSHKRLKPDLNFKKYDCLYFARNDSLNIDQPTHQNHRKLLMTRLQYIAYLSLLTASTKAFMDFPEISRIS